MIVVGSLNFKILFLIS